MRENNDDPTPWLNVHDAARRAKCGRRVIYAAINAGKLKAVRLTARREYRVHVSWLDAWMSSPAALVNPDAPGGPQELPDHQP